MKISGLFLFYEQVPLNNFSCAVVNKKFMTYCLKRQSLFFMKYFLFRKHQRCDRNLARAEGPGKEARLIAPQRGDVTYYAALRLQSKCVQTRAYTPG